MEVSFEKEVEIEFEDPRTGEKKKKKIMKECVTTHVKYKEFVEAFSDYLVNIKKYI